jgi:hypothetical protein
MVEVALLRWNMSYIVLMRLVALGMSAAIGLTVPAPDGRWVWIVESELARKTEIIGENLHKCDIFHHKFHMTLTGIEFAAPCKGSQRLTSWVVALLILADLILTIGAESPRDGKRISYVTNAGSTRPVRTPAIDTSNYGKTAISKARRHRTRTATVPTEGSEIFHRSQLYRHHLTLRSQLFPHNHIPSTPLFGTVQDTAANYLHVTFWDRPPLWSSGQSSWLQIRRSGFDSRHYQKKRKSTGSGTGSTQPREYNWGATW